MLISPFSHLKAEWEMSPRHFNGATRVLQSHCWVLLSQTWMRPPPLAHWRRGKSLRGLHSRFIFLFSGAAVFHSRADFKASSASSGVFMILCFAGECKVTRTQLNTYTVMAPGLSFYLTMHTHTHTHILFYLVGSNSWPSDVHSLIVTHTRTETLICLPPGFCSERGLEGNPQHSSKEQQARGKSLSHISHLSTVAEHHFSICNFSGLTVVLFLPFSSKKFCATWFKVASTGTTTWSCQVQTRA